MMNKDEAVKRLSKVGHISMSYAEDLYDSFFPKPVVPQYVADWYEGNKQNFDLNLSGLVFDLATNSTIYYREELKAWVNDNKKTFITTLVNMHQFGYEVEKETKYRVKLKGVGENNRYLNRNIESTMEFLFSLKKENKKYKTKFTRKELEDADFGWVFSCEGIEIEDVKEADDGND